MPLLRLHLLRHGQTNASRGNLFCGRRLDPPLTDEGLAMATSFATAYRDRRWAGIYSSPLGRAMTTAQPLADAVGLPVQTRDGFAEIDYGAWDGLSDRDVADRFPIEYARWTADPAWNPPPGGETAVTSDGTDAKRTTSISVRMRDALNSRLPGGAGAYACNDSADDGKHRDLCGTTNVQGRIDNGSTNICTSFTHTPSDHFLHVEQSAALRGQSSGSNLDPAILGQAISTVVPGL
jgi:probable phosphoglycerate mutase